MEDRSLLPCKGVVPDLLCIFHQVGPSGSGDFSLIPRPAAKYQFNGEVRLSPARTIRLSH